MRGAQSFKAEFASGAVTAVVGGFWSSRKSFQNSLISSSRQKKWVFGAHVFKAHGTFPKGAVPLFGIVKNNLPKALHGSDGIVTLKCDHLLASHAFVKGQPVRGLEALHTSLEDYRDWLSTQLIGSVYCPADIASKVAGLEGKNAVVWDIYSCDVGSKLPTKQRSYFVSTKEALIGMTALAAGLLAWPFMGAALSLMFAEKTPLPLPLEFTQRDTGAFLQECYTEVSKAGPRTYGFEVVERGCIENGAALFPELGQDKWLAVQISKPTGKVHAHLGAQLSRQAFEDWPHLKAISDEKITSGVIFASTYLPATEVPPASAIEADIRNALFAITRNESGDLRKDGRKFVLETSLEDAVRRLSDIPNIQVSSLIEKITTAGTSVVVTLKINAPIAQLASTTKGTAHD